MNQNPKAINFLDKHPTLILFAIVLLSLLIKNPFIDQPFISHFGSYQSIVAMIAHNFEKQNFLNFLHPTSFLLINGLPALEMIYYPLDSLVAAAFWKLLGGSLDYWGRFQAMLFTAVSTILIYLSAKKIYDIRFGLLSAFFFSFSPMMLIYGRSFMNEPAAMAFLIGSFLMIQHSSERKGSVYVFLAGILLSFSIILRLHFVTALPAIFFFSTYQQTLTKKMLGLFLLGVVLPASLWFLYTYYVSITYTNIHTSLFAQLEARRFPDPLLLSSQFYVQVIGKAFLFRLWGPISLIFICIGFFSIRGTKSQWLWIFFISTIGLIILIPTKYFSHPFYLMPLIFPGSFLAARMRSSV